VIKKFEQFSHIEEMILGVDLDGVLNDFIEGFNVVYHKSFPDNYFVPSDEIDEWFWYQKLDYDGEAPDKWFFGHKAETWYYSKPYPGAIKTMRNLYEYTQDEGIILRIVTSQMTPEAEKASIKWLMKYGIKYDDISFTYRSKDKWDNADVLIDDSPSVLKAKPDNKVSIKVNMKYNIDVNSDFKISKIGLLSPELVHKAFKKLKSL